MHDNVRPGDFLDVTGPHKFFALSKEARRSILLAGGIGITPILAMVEQLRASGQDFRLHYCTTCPERTAFLDRLAPEIASGRVVVHHDDGDPQRVLDLAALLRERGSGDHLYFCGPTGFMNAARGAAGHWPEGTVHFEYFGADPQAGAARELDHPARGELVLADSGRRIDVAPGQTILEALRTAGIEVPTSCEAGMCATCAVRYTAGEPAHNDFVLSDDERRDQVLVCCASVAQGPLVLAL